MTADDHQALREQLKNCTDPGKSIALMKRIKALDGRPKPPPVQNSPENLPVSGGPTNMTQVPPRPNPV